MYRILIPTTAALAACAGGPDTIVPVGAYSGVDNHSDARIVLEQPADADDARTPGPGEYGFTCDGAGELDAAVEDGVLTIEGDHAGDCSVWPAAEAVERLVVRGSGEVTMGGEEPLPALVSLDVRGGGAVRLSAVDAETFDIAAGGTGAVTIDALVASELGLELSGNGDVTLAGVVDHADVLISGTGDLHANALVVDTLDIEVTGSGSAEVYVTGSVRSTVTGSGGVEVEGGAAVEGNLGL